MRVLMILALIVLSGCTNDDTAMRALDGAGYTQVRMTGWDPFSCSKGDAFATGFDAVGPTGKRVSGTVCSGILKGSTIRLD